MGYTLTLTLNNEIIERAKIYATQHNINLSKLIETYLDSITKNSLNTSNSNIVDSLIGVIDLSEDFNYKDEISGCILEKYK